MGGRLWALIRKEFIQIRRDKRTLAMMIVIPTLWLTMFGYAATFDVRSIPLTILNQSTSELAARLIASLEADPSFVVTHATGGRSEVEGQLTRGTASLGLVIPTEFGHPVDAAQVPAQVEVMVDGADFFSAQGGLRMLSPYLQQAAAELAADQARLMQEKVRAALPPQAAAVITSLPFTLPKVTVPRVEILFNPELRSANVMIPALTGLVILFITTLMTALGIVREREHGTLEQIVISPITSFELIIGKLVPYTLIGLFDFVLVVTTGIFVFNVPFVGNLALFTGLATLFLVSTLGLGLLVSTLAQNQQQAIQMALFMVLPQFLLSGMIFPVAAMPEFIRYISFLFPLTYFTPIARGTFLKGLGLQDLWLPALMLAIYGAAMIAFASARFRRRLA